MSFGECHLNYSRKTAFANRLHPKPCPQAPKRPWRLRDASPNALFINDSIDHEFALVQTLWCKRFEFQLFVTSRRIHGQELELLRIQCATSDRADPRNALGTSARLPRVYPCHRADHNGADAPRLRPGPEAVFPVPERGNEAFRRTKRRGLVLRADQSDQGGRHRLLP